MKKNFILMVVVAAACLSLAGCAGGNRNTIQQETTASVIMENMEKETAKAVNEKKVELQEDSKAIVSNKEQEAGVEEIEEIEVLTEVGETAVDETVWCNYQCYARVLPDANAEKAGVVWYRHSYRRTAVLQNGWSRIEFEGGSAYVMSAALQLARIPQADEVDRSDETNELCVGVAKEIFDIVNEERVKAGLYPLVWSDDLARAADVRAEEIVEKFSHERPDGTKCYALDEKVAGENILRGPHATAAEMMEHWMASEGHRNNILRDNFGTIGISVKSIEAGDHAVQLFGY